MHLRFNLVLFLVIASALHAENISVIVNPISGGIDKEALVLQLERELDARIFYTKQRGDGTLLARQAVKEGADIVVAVGGDGTIHEVGQALIDTSTSLAIIPTGSGNGLARSLHIPTDLKQAIQIIQTKHRTVLDIPKEHEKSVFRLERKLPRINDRRLRKLVRINAIRTNLRSSIIGALAKPKSRFFRFFGYTVQINDRFYFGFAGIGFDAEIAERFADSSRRGFISYVTTVLRTFPRYNPTTYKMTIDGIDCSQNAFLICFANGTELGNGAQIAPSADMQDGSFDVVIVRPFPFYVAPELAYRLFHASFDQSPYVRSFKAREITIQQPQIVMQIDGEPVVFFDQVHLKIHPASLHVIAP